MESLHNESEELAGVSGAAGLTSGEEGQLGEQENAAGAQKDVPRELGSQAGNPAIIQPGGGATTGECGTGTETSLQILPAGSNVDAAPCSLCFKLLKKRFQQRHAAAHLKNQFKPFGCTVCSYAGTIKAYAQSHMRTKHGMHESEPEVLLHDEDLQQLLKEKVHECFGDDQDDCATEVDLPCFFEEPDGLSFFEEPEDRHNSADLRLDLSPAAGGAIASNLANMESSVVAHASAHLSTEFEAKSDNGSSAQHTSSASDDGIECITLSTGTSSLSTEDNRTLETEHDMSEVHLEPKDNAAENKDNVPDNTSAASQSNKAEIPPCPEGFRSVTEPEPEDVEIECGIESPMQILHERKQNVVPCHLCAKLINNNKRKNSKRRHAATHLKGHRKPFGCTMCSYAGNRKDFVRLHMQKKHHIREGAPRLLVDYEELQHLLKEKVHECFGDVTTHINTEDANVTEVDQSSIMEESEDDSDLADHMKLHPSPRGEEETIVSHLAKVASSIVDHSSAHLPGESEANPDHDSAKSPQHSSPDLVNKSIVNSSTGTTISLAGRLGDSRPVQLEVEHELSDSHQEAGDIEKASTPPIDVVAASGMDGGSSAEDNENSPVCKSDKIEIPASPEGFMTLGPEEVEIPDESMIALCEEEDLHLELAEEPLYETSCPSPIAGISSNNVDEQAFELGVSSGCEGKDGTSDSNSMEPSKEGMHDQAWADETQYKKGMEEIDVVFCPSIDVSEALETVQQNMEYLNRSKATGHRSTPVPKKNSAIGTDQKTPKKVCRLCSESMSRQTAQARHAASHLDLKAFKCPHCRLKATRCITVMQHMNKVHRHLGHMGKPKIIATPDDKDYKTLLADKLKECFGGD